MSEVKFDDADFEEVIMEIVPAFQRDRVIAGLKIDAPTDSDFDLLGTALTGEQGSSSFLLLTRAPTTGGTSMWAAVKSEIYDFFCTTSKKYAEERKEGTLTLKNIITIVSTALAASFNIALGVVVGAVTLAVMSVCKIGRNAWCEVNRPSKN